jgi:hypothetical protein
VNNRETLEKNLLQSRLIREERYPLLIQEGFTNISKAYNQAMKKTDAEILVFLHQDVLLPDDWESKLLQALNIIQPTNWGVIGIAGVRLVNMRQVYLGHVLDRGSEWGSAEGLPTTVDTLDELLLIIKNNKKIEFDENIPFAHFYGADICLQARSIGLKCIAIEAYCHHNSRGRRDVIYTPEFQTTMEYMRNKWRNHLPFATTCAIVDGTGLETKKTRFSRLLKNLTTRLGLK